MQLSGRPGQHDHGWTVSGHHQPRRRARWIDRRRAARHHGLLSVCRPQGLGVEAQPAGEPGDDLGDPLLHPLVEDEVATGEVGHHLGREVVRRGAEAAAGDDQAHALPGEEGECGSQVRTPVAHADDVADVHAELGEALGEPWPVAVRDSRGQHLRAGDHDPGPDAVGLYGQLGPLKVVG